MADNVQQALKDLNASLVQADKNLITMTQTLSGFFKQIKQEGRDVKAIFDYISQKAGKTGATKAEKIKIISEFVDKNGKPLSPDSISDAIEKVKKKGSPVKFDLLEINREKVREMENYLRLYKKIYNMTPAQWQNTVMAPIDKALGGGSKSQASKEWKDQTKLNNETKKAAAEAQNGYIKQAQAAQQLTKTLEELRAKRAELESLPVTGIGKAGESFKSETTKANAIKKLDAEIVKTEKDFNDATVAAQGFEAKLIAIGQGKRVSNMKKALGIDVVEPEMQKIPTVFDRVIEQINQRAAQNKDKLTKQLVDANGIKNEAENAFKSLRLQMPPLTRKSWQELINIQNGPLGMSTLFAQNAMSQKMGWDVKSIEAMRSYQDALQSIINLQDKLTQSQRSYNANVSAVEGVTRRFNENEQAIARVRDRWEELNVKKQAGLVSQKDFDTQTQKILDEYDRLIAKKKEFEIGDLGQLSSQRKQFQERYKELLKEKDAAEKARIARGLASTDPNMNAAVNKQVQYQRQLIALRKEYNALNNKQNRTQEENAILEQTKNKIKDIIGLSKQLNKEQQGSHGLAKQITDYDRIKQKIHEANKSTKEHKASLESMLPTLQRLASAFGVAFSVQGLVQFAKKLVDTRGEFELQQTALRSILQNKQLADEIWDKTMQAALQSPFTAMKLTTYTKQLAAYRIETEKLFDTTKMLADVSAGLGVDMQRLILAYGQVKTANYLRASEVRQFTEAGVNIYGELAKYFSEVEGRAVGTAEVVERVTKRMVLFSDVEKIFQRMTEEGGTFFNMQEVQADTVRGQIMKLRDAYDQMLNSIGQSNQGTIRDFVDSLNNIVRNWQNVAFVIKSNINWITIFGGALVLLSRNYMKSATTQTLWFGKAIMGNKGALLSATKDVKIFSNVIGDYTLKQRMAIVATRTLQGALGTLGNVLRTLWPFLAFEAVVLMIERIRRAERELKRMKKELEDVASTNVNNMNEEINGYNSLIEKLKKTTEGTQARKEVLDEISQKYGKYIDFVITEKTTIEELAGAYDKVVGSIRSYTAEKIREEQQQRVEKGLYDEYQDLIGSLTGTRISDIGGNQNKITKSQAQNIAKLIQKELEAYGVADIQKILEDYFGNQFNFNIGGSNTGIRRIINSYVSQWQELKNELDSIRDDIEGTTPVFKTDEEYNKYKKNIELANEALLKQQRLYEQQVSTIKDAKRTAEEQWKIEDELAELRIKNEEEILNIKKKYGLLTEKQYNDELLRLRGQLDSYETDYNRRLEDSLSKQYGSTWKTANKEARDMYKYVVSTEDALQQGTQQRNKQLKESYSGLKESLKDYESALRAGGDKETLEKNITWTKLMMNAIELAAKLRGLDLADKKKSGSGTNYKSISSLISILKEMNSEYDKLSKSAYGFAKSNEKVRDSFKDAFNEIFKFSGIDINQVDTTSKESTAKAMELVLNTLDAKKLWGKFGKDGGEKARQEFLKAWGQMKAEVDIQIAEQSRADFGRKIEEMFSDYDLTLSLDSMGIPKDLAKKLFGIDTSSLDEISRYIESFVTTNAENWNEDINKIYQDALKKISDKEQEQYKKDVSNLFKRVKSTTEEMNIVVEQASADINFAQHLFDPKYVDEATKTIKDKILENQIKIQELTPSEGGASGVALQEIKRLESENDILQHRADRLQQMYGNLSAKDYSDLVRSTIEWENDNLRKISTEKLKKLPEYLEAMGRVAGKTNGELKKMLTYLTDLISKGGNDLEINEYKSIVSQIQEINKEIDANNYPFGVEGFAKVAKMFKDAKKYEDEMLRLEQERTKLLEEQKQINDQITSTESQLQVLKDKKSNGFFTDDDQRKMTELGGSLTNLYDQQSINSNNLTQNFSKMQSMGGKVAQVLAIIDTIIHAINDTVQRIYDIDQLAVGLLDDYGYDTEHGGIAQWSKGLETFAKSSQAATDGWDAFKKGDAAGVTYNVIKSLTEIWHGINQMVDMSLSDEIYALDKQIKILEKSYKRLEKQIDKAFDSISYMETYNKMLDNLNERLKYTYEQINAERDKKNTDEDKIDEYNDKVQEYLDELEEIKRKQIEEFGGIGEDSYKSAAEDFVNAWKDAFLETGDGLKGLQEHFDEFINDWFVKQATMRISSKMLESVFEEIDKAVGEDSEGGVNVTMQEIERVRKMFEEVSPELASALEGLYGQFGIGKDGSLSGLAAGIQGITEEQANVLEAYWNSVRSYTANIDSNVARIASILGAGGVNTNPMITHLRNIESHTIYIPRIHEILDSVVRNMGQGTGVVTYAL